MFSPLRPYNLLGFHARFCGGTRIMFTSRTADLPPKSNGYTFPLHLRRTREQWVDAESSQRSEKFAQLVVGGAQDGLYYYCIYVWGTCIKKSVRRAYSIHNRDNDLWNDNECEGVVRDGRDASSQGAPRTWLVLVLLSWCERTDMRFANFARRGCGTYKSAKTHTHTEEFVKGCAAPSSQFRVSKTNKKKSFAPFTFALGCSIYAVFRVSVVVVVLCDIYYIY